MNKKPELPLHHYQQPASRRSFVLRLWGASQAAGWRASLEDPYTGEKFGFSTLEQLFAFIMELCDGDSGAPSRKRS